MCHVGCAVVCIRGRGDVVTRFILLRSADAYAMQLCKQGLVYLWACGSRAQSASAKRIASVWSMNAIANG